MLVKTFFEEEYLHAKLTDASVRSIEQYRIAIGHWSKFNKRPPTIKDFSDTAMDRFASWMVGERNLAVPTANKVRRHLKAIWNFAFERGEVKRPPRFKRLKELEKDPVAWTPEEIGRLLDAINRLCGKINGVPSRLFWRALILFLYDTGARINVTMHLEPRHIDLRNRTVLLPAEYQKQGKDQVVDISEETAAILRELIDKRRTYVFCWPYDRYPGSTWTTLHRHFRILVGAAELDIENGTFHRIRRTTATQIADKFDLATAQTLLGHASQQTTKRYVSEFLKRKQSNRPKLSDTLARTWA
jgi:integrase